MMTPEQHKILTDQFDQSRSQKTSASPGFDDAEKQQEWEILELAADAIRLYALTEQVKRGRLRFEAQATDSVPVYDSEPVFPIRKNSGKGRAAGAIETDRPASADRQPAIHPAASASRSPVRRLISPAMQIAAIFVLVIAGAVLIKFSNVRPEGVFERNYSAYALSVTRGADASDALEQAYRDKNWPAVYSAFQATHTKTQKEYFLTAMAHMQQKDYYEAISLLKTLIQYNASGEPYFQDEAEYYLAMNYLATGQSAPAIALFNKIKADPRHIFHSRVMDMSQLDLRILQVK
jgi:tetratricopeptide (TPR) repeat protein